tara:strand:- start:521 stop:715 length:195 start_codon:yes stop_codon:yes gene_type:complete
VVVVQVTVDLDHLVVAAVVLVDLLQTQIIQLDRIQYQSQFKLVQVLELNQIHKLVEHHHILEHL